MTQKVFRDDGTWAAMEGPWQAWATERKRTEDPPYIWGSLVAQAGKKLPAKQKTRVPSLGQEDPLEKEMATHSSTLAWKISMDWGAWWAAVYGVAQSRTRPKRLSSSSSRLVIAFLPRSKRLLILWLQWFWSPRKWSLSLFPLFPHLPALKWWDWMPWYSFFECCLKTTF